MALDTKAPTTGKGDADGLLGFITADELVALGQKVSPQFSRLKLWLLVSAGLLPTPAFDLPVKPRNRGLFLDYLTQRLMMILANTDLPLAQLKSKLGEYAYQEKAEHHTTANAALHPAADRYSVMWRRHAAQGTAGHPYLSPLFQTYLSQLFHPVDLVGKIAKLAGEFEGEWQHDEQSELQLAWKITSTIAEETSLPVLTVALLLQYVDQAQVRLQGVKTDYLAWRDQIDAQTIDQVAALAEQDTEDGMLIQKQRKPHVNKFITAISLFKFSGIMLVLYTLLVVSKGIQQVDTYKNIFSGAFALFSMFLAYSVFASLFRILLRGKQITLTALWDTIDYFVGVVLAYSAVYYLLSLSGRIAAGNEGKLSGLDCAYFSIVTVTTTGFGDIIPTSSLARIVVGSEILFGTLFTVIIVGILISRLNQHVEE